MAFKGMKIAALLTSLFLLPFVIGCNGGYFLATVEVLGAPTMLTATAGNGQVVLSWIAPTGSKVPESYNIYYSSNSGVTPETGTKVSAGSTNSYTQTGLTNGTTYYFVVTAVYGVGESAASNQASATPAAPVVIPSAPTNLAATAGNAQVALTWTASAGATSYNLYWSTSSGVTPANGTKIPNISSASYTQTGLTNGTTYYYVVTAVDSAGESGASSQASATPVAPILAPSAPTGLAATAGNAQVSLTWTASTGATSYNLYWSTATGVTPANGTKIGGITNPTYVQTGLTNGTTYYYVVTAVDAGGESPASNQASATPVAPVVAPSAPTSLAATAGNTQVSLTWTASAGATSYNLYWSTTTGVTPANGTKIAGITNPAYVQTGLTNGTTYFYVVTAVDSAGESGPSNQASATPAAPIASAPTNLAATAGNAQVSLTWTASTGATSYNLYWSTTAGVTPANGTKISGITNPAYVQTGLTNGTTYYYVVTAVNSAGESGPSNQASATPVAAIPAAPLNLTATAGNTQVILNWSASAGAVTYNLYWSTTTGVTPANGTKISGIAGTTYTQTGLTNGTTYYYVVTAVDTGGESPASNQASATPVAATVGAPVLSVTPGNGQAMASWTTVSGATSYNLYYSLTSPVAIATATKVGSISGTNYTVPGLNNCTTYYFAVTAVSGGTESALSNQVSAAPVSPTAVSLTPGTAASLTLDANATTTLNFSFPANAVTQPTTISLTPITQPDLPVPFTQTVASYVTGIGVCAVPSVTTFGSPVVVSGTVANTYTSGTQLNLSALNNTTYADTATFLVGASGALTESIPTLALPGLTTPGTFVLYQPATGTNTAVANIGIAIYADDSTAPVTHGVNIVQFYGPDGTLLTTPIVRFVAIPTGGDLDGQGLTPDASVAAIVDGGNTVNFITGIQNGNPVNTTATVDVTNYGGDGDSVVMLPNGDEAIVTADDGGPLVYISGILSGTPVIASTLSNGPATNPNFRDGLVISNDGKVMLARGQYSGTAGIDVYSITPIAKTPGTIAGTVTHQFTLVTTLTSADGTVSTPIFEDGRDGMAISPADSSRAVVIGENASFAPVIQVITGLPSAPVAGPPISLPDMSFDASSVAISPDGTLAVVGSEDAPGLYLYSGVNTGNLTLVGSLYDPTFTMPAAGVLIPAGTVVKLGTITTLGFSLDGKYLVAADAAYTGGNGVLEFIPVSASGLGAPALIYVDPNGEIPYNDQMIIH